MQWNAVQFSAVPCGRRSVMQYDEMRYDAIIMIVIMQVMSACHVSIFICNIRVHGDNPTRMKRNPKNLRTYMDNANPLPLNL